MNDWSELTLPGACHRTVPTASADTGHDVRVWCPPDAGRDERLPVIYVLDGNDLFPLVADTVRRLSRRPEATHVRPTIVVGVDTTKRRHWHLTPGPPAEETVRDHDTGGADAFLAFLRDDLAPIIERDFPADPHRRILFGHSLAGFFTLHVLATQAQYFDRYIAISPSIWWDEVALRSGLAQHAPRGKRVFMAAGEWEGELPPWQRQHDSAERALERRGRRSMLVRTQRLADELESILGPENTVLRIFPDEDHASVMLVATARALRFVLPFEQEGPDALSELVKN